MGKVERLKPYLEPLRKSVTVRRSPEEAFEVFTSGIGRWWPLAQYSVYGTRARACGIDPVVGGEIYELRDDGERCAWGRVLAWEPPHRFVVTWHPGRGEETAQEVEIRFVPEAGAARVELEHRGWAKLGDKARETRSGYEQGWDAVLGDHYRPACEGGGRA